MAASIRSFDWAETPLGPVDSWPGTLRVVVDTLLPCGFPMVLLWGPDLVQVYNDGYRALMGNKHPAGLGQPTRACWPEVWHINEPIYARVWAGETLTFEDALYPIARSGRLEDAWFTLTYSPVRDEAGAVGGVLVTIFETTDRLLSERALSKSEARFRQFAEASSGALWIRDAQTLAMEYASPAIAEIYGVAPGAFLGEVELWAASILPEDRDAALAHLEQARLGDSAVDEFRIQRPADGSFRWVRNTVFPLFDEEGRVRRVGGVFEDITEARLAVEHQGVLLAELQHRVRNIMAIIRSITARTADTAGSVPEYAALMADGCSRSPGCRPCSPAPPTSAWASPPSCATR